MAIGVTEAGILVLVILALSGIMLAAMWPHRTRTAGINDNPEAREAFRANIIQVVTLVLIVIGAAVALKQLAASLEELQTVRMDQLTDEIEALEARLQATDSDEQIRVDAITDLSRVHAKSPEHRGLIERDLLRYVQRHAALPDRSALTDRSELPRDIQEALNFLLTKGQEEVEPDWQTAGEGNGLLLANLDLRGVQLPGANLTGVDFSRTLLWDANLQNARMDGAALIRTELRGARLQRAVLRGSILTDADLEGATVTEADFAEADLRGVRNLTWAQVRDASVACSTKMPEQLPESSQTPTDVVSMILVLRDCLLPEDLHIPADTHVAVLVGTTLSDPVTVRAPELGIDVQVPDRTQTVEAPVTAPPGTYRVAGEADLGASRVEGRVIAIEGESLLAQSGNAPPTNEVEPEGSGAAGPVPTPTATERALTAPLPTATSISIPTVLPAGGGCDPNVPNICIPPGLEPQDGDEGGVDIDSDFDAYPVLPDPGSGDSEPTMVAALPRPSPTVVSPLSTPTIVAPTPHLTMTSAPVPDRDCVDFTSQKEAQAFFEATGGPEVDIHRLDTDGDGIACSAVP